MDADGARIPIPIASRKVVILTNPPVPRRYAEAFDFQGCICSLCLPHQPAHNVLLEFFILRVPQDRHQVPAPDNTLVLCHIRMRSPRRTKFPGRERIASSRGSNRRTLPAACVGVLELPPGGPHDPGTLGASIHTNRYDIRNTRSTAYSLKDQRVSKPTQKLIWFRLVPVAVKHLFLYITENKIVNVLLDLVAAGAGDRPYAIPAPFRYTQRQPKSCGQVLFCSKPIQRCRLEC